MMLRSVAQPVAIMRWHRELLHLMVLILEGCWLTLWFMVLAPGATLRSTGLNAIFVFGNMLTALALIRIPQAFGVSTRVARLLVVAGLLAGIGLAVYVVLPIDSPSILTASFPPQKVPFIPGPAVAAAL